MRHWLSEVTSVNKKRKLGIAVGLICIALACYYFLTNARVSLATACVSTSPCQAYRDVFGQYYYVEINGVRYLIERSSRFTTDKDIVYITGRSVIPITERVIVVNIRQPRLPVNGSHGKMNGFDAGLVIDNAELRFTTIKKEMVSVKR
jgi:hypothetical protein